MYNYSSDEVGVYCICELEGSLLIRAPSDKGFSLTWTVRNIFEDEHYSMPYFCWLQVHSMIKYVSLSNLTKC